MKIGPGVFVLNKVPGLVDYQYSSFWITADAVPDIVQNNIHGDRPQIFFEVSDSKNRERIFDVKVGALIEDAGGRTLDKFFQPVCQLFCLWRFHSGQDLVKIL